MKKSAKERQFSVNGMMFSALEWGEVGDEPVIALHGWLDNAATFTHLLPELKGLHVIAIDMAGHGRSDHRPGVGAYSFWDDVHDLIVLADVLGWKKFSLMGHSRGAIIAAITAASFPDRINKLLLIEGLAGTPVSAQKSVEQLSSSISSLMGLWKKPKRIYQDRDTAIRARMNGMFTLSEFAATPLTDRGIKPVEGGYTWASDMRLFSPSPIKLSQEHTFEFLRSIRCPALLILGQDGLPKLYPGMLELIQTIPHIPYVLLEGGHHLHLEQQYPMVAREINNFFKVNH